MKSIETAIEVAESFGLRIHEPQLLRSTNNVVAWLRPTSVVAKVGSGHHPGFFREIRIASELRALHAPVVAPASEVPAVIHSRNGFDISYWHYHPQPADWDVSASILASALRRLHEAYATISAELRADLPSYLVELESVSQLLRDNNRLASLANADRVLLIAAFDRLKERMRVLSPGYTHMTIHGSPHSYNILLADDEPCFIDFETTCIGPCEWDLAHMAPEVVRTYNRTTNAELLEVCRNMVSVKTAAWCWADADRGDLRYHAEIHLAEVKRLFRDDARQW